MRENSESKYTELKYFGERFCRCGHIFDEHSDIYVGDVNGMFACIHSKDIKPCYCKIRPDIIKQNLFINVRYSMGHRE